MVPRQHGAGAPWLAAEVVVEMDEASGIGSEISSGPQPSLPLTIRPLR